MKPGRVALGVALLLIVMLAGAYTVVEIRAQRTLDSVDALERELLGQARREPFPPAKPGQFYACAEVPPHRSNYPLETDCSIYSKTGGAEVPASCARLLADGEGWVEQWLRCTQRSELGDFHRMPVMEHVGDAEPGNWLAVRLHTLPPQRALELCRLTMAHARDYSWSYGADGCAQAVDELLSVKAPCGVALEKVDATTRSAFLEEARLRRSQLPDQKWFRRYEEVEAFHAYAVMPMSSSTYSWTQRFKAKYRLPELKRRADQLIDSEPPLSSRNIELELFKGLIGTASRLEDCEQLPKGYDLLIELASINP
ncbi:MAG: hypothetical protein QM723_26005 [Myxococcaceae bacterium]